jgi:site-specific recombinase XerD
MIQKQFDSIKLKFSEYLTNLNISPNSHKNYRSDLSHFTEWLILKLHSFGFYAESFSEAVPFLSSDIANEYVTFMTQNKIPVKTINRRLSTLRHLSKYLFSSHTLEIDFMKSVENISLGRLQKTAATLLIVEDFQSYLEKQKVPKSAVKNYVSDIRQFLAWVESVNSQQVTN